jgi:ATP-dependent helicase/nuclease subunit B
MALLAEQAYALLSEYEQHSQRRTPWGTEDGDARAFQVWADDFDKECRRNGWISRSAITARLTERLASSSASGELLLVGFDRLTPAATRLLETWTTAGGSWRHLQQENEPDHLRFFVATDFQQELESCAQWLRSKLDENAESRLAVVLPDGHGTRGEIERVFRRVLAPESLLLTERVATPLPFEFSLGIPLSQVEEIRAALFLLRWLTSPIADEELRWLLSSGFLAQTQEETIATAQTYHAFRKRGIFLNEWTLHSFLVEKKLNHTPAFRSLMQRLTKFSHEAIAGGVFDETQSPLDWASLAIRLLQIAGWPGAISKGSAHFQILRRWEQLLDEVTALGFDGRTMSFAEFLSALERQSSETVFAEESRGAPVQIMGPLETSGQTFDGIWFLGAEEQNWPAKSNAHPLIPSWISRAAGMPHATAEVDWDLARTATERIAASAPDVTFSYAQRDKDGELRPSPVVKRLFSRPAAILQMETSAQEAIGLEPALDQILEPIDDEKFIPFPGGGVAGGSDLLKRQSACPFRAFAGVRLNAQALQSVEMGLSASQRGSPPHNVLEMLWKKFQSQEGLIEQRNAGILQATVNEVIREVIDNDPATQHKEGWRAAYYLAERRRLEKLVLEWLEYETRRMPFWDVAVEQEQKHVDIGALRLHMRVDRLDTVAEGRKLLIDYKTGKVSPKSWEGERPEDPQLPLYASFGELGDICGLLFAQIRAGEIEVKGRAEDAVATVHSELRPQQDLVKKPLTAEMRSQWRTELEKLADSFLRGETTVDPKKPVKTCQLCDLSSLCRKAETLIPLRAAEQDENEINDDPTGN